MSTLNTQTTSSFYLRTQKPLQYLSFKLNHPILQTTVRLLVNPCVNIFAKARSHHTILLFTTLCFFIPTTQAATVFINELHYDNIGTDTNEGVEIAGIAGTQLNDWMLLFYNGSDGSVYKESVLNGTIADTSNGYGVLSFSLSGLQNGPADGVALIDNNQQVIEFISYEGAILATDGLAQGLTSIDILLSETNSTAITDTLQRTGTGEISDDFIWSNQMSSFGSLNLGQTFESTAVPIPNAAILFSSALACLVRRKAKS